MATSRAPRSAPAETGRRVRHEEGTGWLDFAGVMLAVIGTLNVIYGIAAIDQANVFVGNAQFVFSGLKTWGWLILLIGVVQVIGAFAIWSRNAFGRWIGIA